MGSLNILQTLPTADSMALNAGMYGFAEHGMLTPHAALKQMWWTEERITAHVTRKFVVKQIRGAEREFLDKPIGISGELTDDTYMEWILYRAQRLFLILSQLNCADRIFSLIDDSWQDEDLPIPRSDVKRLELALENNDKLNRKFYDMQFYYLLRQPGRGEHIEYGPCEHIPMDYVNSLSPAVSISQWHRVHFPGPSQKPLVRRRFDLTEQTEEPARRFAFLEDVAEARSYKHEHIAPVWATYTSNDSGYVLTDFVAEHTLRSFMDHRTPPQFSRLAEEQRHCLLLEWMHCLADAVAYLHSRGQAHGNIRPSNILVDQDNCIAFADIGHLRTFDQDKTADKHELRDYAPPNKKSRSTPTLRLATSPLSLRSHTSSTSLSKTPKTPKTSHLPALSFASTSTTSTISSARTSASAPSKALRNFSRHIPPPLRKDSIHDDEDSNPYSKPGSALPTPPMSPSSEYGVLSPYDDIARDFDAILNRFNTSPVLSRADTLPLDFPSPPSKLSAVPRADSPTTTTAPSQRSSSVATTVLRLDTTPDANPQQNDIFSLGAIYLDILTFLLQGKITDFLKYRRKSVGNTSRPPALQIEHPDMPLSPTFSVAESASTVSTKKSVLSALTPYQTIAAASWGGVGESFFARPTAVESWLERLRLAALQQPSVELSMAVSEMSGLIRRMLQGESSARPDAVQVKAEMERILGGTVGMGGLCCAGREWTGAGMKNGGGNVEGLTAEETDRGLWDALDRARTEMERAKKERESEAKAAEETAKVVQEAAGLGIEGVDGAEQPNDETSGTARPGTATGQGTERSTSSFSDDSAEVQAKSPMLLRSPWKMPPIFKRKTGPTFRMP